MKVRQGNQRLFSLSLPLRDSLSPLPDLLSPLHGVLSFSRRKISSKTSWTRVLPSIQLPFFYPVWSLRSAFLYWPTLKFSLLHRNFRQRIYLESFRTKQNAIREYIRLSHDCSWILTAACFPGDNVRLWTGARSSSLGDNFWISLTALRPFCYSHFVIRQDHGFGSPREPHQLPGWLSA